MALPSGMAEDPGKSYSIASRLVCAKCGVEPIVKRAEGRDPIIITVQCHGEEETKAIERKELVFTQAFFGSND